jgi:uncharacterized membrane protein
VREHFQLLLPDEVVAWSRTQQAAHKSSERLGLSEEQLRTIKEEVTEGTSVLFAVTDQGDLDRLGERFRGMPWKLVETNLTAGERAELVEALGGA